MAEGATLRERVSLLAATVADGAWCDAAGREMAAEQGVAEALRLLGGVLDAGRRVYVIGNGGSAAVASHAVNDMVNMGRIKALTLTDPALLSCLTNDYGYEVAFARMLAVMAEAGDLLVAISSSGRSANIRNAAEAMRAQGGRVFTLSGFSADNPLRRLGDLNLWLNSDDYGIVETGHAYVLHHVSDRLVQQIRGQER